MNYDFKFNREICLPFGNPFEDKIGLFENYCEDK